MKKFLDKQRIPLPDANWFTTIYHGIPENLITPRWDITPTYLAFLGRISIEKRADRAILIAQKAGLPIKIAAKIDKPDYEYYVENVKNLMSLPHVEFIGQITDAQKSEFLSGAIALLFPIDWEEPFGLVMIEALAAGTPVIAYRRGSVPEIIKDGVTGFIVENEEEAVDAVKKLHKISRKRVREEFEKKFT